MRAFLAKGKPVSLPTLRYQQLSIGEVENGLIRVNGKAGQDSVPSQMPCAAVAEVARHAERLQTPHLGPGHPKGVEVAPRALWVPLSLFIILIIT